VIVKKIYECEKDGVTSKVQEDLIYDLDKFMNQEDDSYSTLIKSHFESNHAFNFIGED
jgi:hypothetical protein